MAPTPELLLRLLLWVVAGLGVQLCLFILVGAWLQVRRDRFNAFRIACHRRWEHEVVEFAFAGGQDAEPFRSLSPAERRLFIPFLLRVLRNLAGSEGEAIRNLYRELGLEAGLGTRLRSRVPQERAMAALEVGSFGLGAHWNELLPLLEDPVPHVAHAAARALAESHDMAFAEALLQWVLAQVDFQQERLLWILEAFGPEFLPWLGERLEALESPDPRLQVLFALLAASTRQGDPVPRLLGQLHSEELEVLAASIKALGALGAPEALEPVRAFREHPAWVVRAQVAKALGVLGGTGSIPELLGLMEDPVFEVRRNAAAGLFQTSQGGRQALAWVAEDPGADPYARDLALEQLQWSRMGAPA